jgi:hypothetical protein
VQRGVRPIWQVIGDGCHPDRETWIVLENAGFESVNYQHFQAPFPIVSPHIVGVATKFKNNNGFQSMPAFSLQNQQTYDNLYKDRKHATSYCPGHMSAKFVAHYSQ